MEFCWLGSWNMVLHTHPAPFIRMSSLTLTKKILVSSAALALTGCTPKSGVLTNTHSEVDEHPNYVHWDFKRWRQDSGSISLLFYSLDFGKNVDYETETTLANGDIYIDEGKVDAKDLAILMELSSNTGSRQLAGNLKPFPDHAHEGAERYKYIDLTFPMLECHPRPDCIVEKQGSLMLEPSSPNVQRVQSFVEDFAARHRGHKTQVLSNGVSTVSGI